MSTCRYLLLVLLQLFSTAFAQKQNLKFTHLGTNDGLSHSNIICLLQDSRGFMWFGTRDGLNMYDGYSFIVYKNNVNDKNSISDNTINDIVEDSNGILWIATWGGGLNQFNRESQKFTRYRHDPDNPNTISSDLVNSIMIDHEGILWIGTQEGGLNRYDPKNKTFTHYAHHKNDPRSLTQNLVKDVFEDSQHNMWVGTVEGLNLFDRESKTFTRFQHDEKNPGSLSANAVECIFEDSQHQLWIGTRDGLNEWNHITKEFKRLKTDDHNSNSLVNNVVLSMNEDLSGNLWIGTENGGLSVYNKRTAAFHNYVQDDSDPASLSNNSIWAIYRDAKGGMWACTFSGDINFWSIDGNKFTHYRHSFLRNSLSHNKVLCIYEDSKDNLWIGTDGGGINLFDRKTGRFTHYKYEKNNPRSICGNFVLSITEDSHGNLWIGTWGDGITVFNPVKKTYKHFKNNPQDPNSLSSNNAWTILEDRNKDIWIGTYYGGLNLYNPGNNTFTHFKHDENDHSTISSNTINTIFEDSRGNLWLGTDGSGLNLFDRKTKTSTHFQYAEGKNSISNNAIGKIFEDHAGNLWVGTMLGLNLFDIKNKVFTPYRCADGLPNESIYGILEDDKNNLWISTNKGACRFNPATKSFKNFGVVDGLQSNEFKQNACWKSRSGALYFGGNNGFNEFFPDSIKEISYEPPIVLTDFQLFNESVPIADSLNRESPLKKHITETREIILPYDQSKISFEFASLNYTSPERKQYSYILEGFDKDWNYIGSKRTATYTNLDPGEYTFKVQGLDNKGNWAPGTINVRLVITPPYWRTWWFRTLFILSVIGIALSIYKARINAIQKQKNHLEKLVKERTHEMAQQQEDIQTQSEYLENINQELVGQREEILLQREKAEQARIEAEQANQAKSVFLATMSHEIRTPMNGVIGMASLLAETSLTSEQQEYTETIKSCGESLLGVINDILDFSKIESGKMELEQKDFDLRVCIEEVLDVFAGKAAKAGLDLMYEIDYNVPALVIGDSLRLRQVLMNLVGNAIKFTHEGEIFVRVHQIKTEDEQVELGFEVRDTGIGIPEDKVSRLFKAFSQVDSSTTRKYGGTGLGLVISEKLVELMGGSIAVKSHVGQGTTFSFTIKSTISFESVRTYVQYNMAGLEGKKVLVVDDNPTNRGILKNQLEHWKLTPTLAFSGQQALMILAQTPGFDLIITDMQMPGMDGLQLAQTIRQLHAQLPVILLSSIGNDSYKSYPGLFSSVLTKPVRQSTLCKHILAQLRQQPDKPFVAEPDAKKKLHNDFSKQYPLRILVTEDNPVNQKLAERVLTKLGYEPEKALNGQEALHALDQKYYDLILMDVQMPVMDGLEATRKIRLRPGIQPVIIAMTANAMQGDRDQCLQAGMDDYISKPVKLEDLINLIEKWALNLQTKIDADH